MYLLEQHPSDTSESEVTSHHSEGDFTVDHKIVQLSTSVFVEEHFDATLCSCLPAAISIFDIVGELAIDKVWRNITNRN